MTDEFVFSPARRKNTSLLIALAGASGSGKTFTALELATGLSPAGKIAFIDTEARRGLHYADRFTFQHADMRPPFSPQRMTAAIHAAERTGAEVVIIDSMSHEHDGEGGILDWANELAEGTPKAGIANPRSPNDGDGWKDWERKPVPSPGNWKEPKLAHKEMMNAFLQSRAHLIFCLRAEEKIRINKAAKETNWKTTIDQLGWIPICEKRFMFEMTLSLTLRPDAPGLPQYDLPHKIQDQHRKFFQAGKLISREAGRQLGEWARGDGETQTTTGFDAVEWGRQIYAKRKAHTDAAMLAADFAAHAEELKAADPKAYEAVAAAVAGRIAELGANTPA